MVIAMTERILRFPSDRSIGHVTRYSSENDAALTSTQHTAPQQTIEARGDVKVREAGYVALAYRAGTVADLALLAPVGATDLDLLSCAFCTVYDDDLVHLRHLTSLHELVLTDTMIVGPGLRYLQALPRLRRLALNFTRLTDAALPHLRALHRLQWLTITGTPLGRADCARVRQILPQCEVWC